MIAEVPSSWHVVKASFSQAVTVTVPRLFSAECVGDKASVEGVRGDDELCDDDSGLEGSNAGTGTGTWCCVDCRV